MPDYDDDDFSLLFKNLDEVIQTNGPSHWCLQSHDWFQSLRDFPLIVNYTLCMEKLLQFYKQELLFRI